MRPALISSSNVMSLTIDVSLSCSDQFDRHGSGFTTTNAKCCNATPLAVLQRVDERHDDARANRTNGVTLCARAAVHVDAGGVQIQGACCQHRYHSESFVDLP